MANVLKQIFSEGETKAGDKSQGLMPLLGQGEKMTWWRPLIIPFRPLVILYNLILKSRSGKLLPLSGTQGPQLVQTNEQIYEISWDEMDRPTKVIVHRRVNEV